MSNQETTPAKCASCKTVFTTAIGDGQCPECEGELKRISTADQQEEIELLLKDLTTLKPMLISFAGEEQQFYPLPPESANLLVTHVLTLQSRLQVLEGENVFNDWLKHHGCSKHELFLIQNCLGTIFGFDSQVAKEATEAWRKSDSPKRNFSSYD